MRVKFFGYNELHSVILTIFSTYICFKLNFYLEILYFLEIQSPYLTLTSHIQYRLRTEFTKLLFRSLVPTWWKKSTAKSLQVEYFCELIQRQFQSWNLVFLRNFWLVRNLFIVAHRRGILQHFSLPVSVIWPDLFPFMLGKLLQFRLLIWIASVYPLLLFRKVALALTNILLFLWLKKAKKIKKRFLQFCRFLELLNENCL